MHMHLMEAVDRVWTLRRDYFNALRNAVYGDFYIFKSHIAIGHTLKRLKP